MRSSKTLPADCEARPFSMAARADMIEARVSCSGGQQDRDEIRKGQTDGKETRADY